MTSAEDDRPNTTGSTPTGTDKGNLPAENTVGRNCAVSLVPSSPLRIWHNQFDCYPFEEAEKVTERGEWQFGMARNSYLMQTAKAEAAKFRDHSVDDFLPASWKQHHRCMVPCEGVDSHRWERNGPLITLGVLFKESERPKTIPDCS